MPPPPLTERACLDGFREALSGESRKATFTCGGRIPIVLEPNRTISGDLTPRTDLRVQEQRVVVKPVTIRWGPGGAGRVLSLPAQTPEDHVALEQLVQDCKPATFGLNGKDVLDETYRRAGAMATDKFMTDFCPYETGIIDIVTQLLLPPIAGELEPGPSRSKLAEEFDLTADEDRQIGSAIERQMSLWNSLGEFHTSQVPALLAQLNAPAASQDELDVVLETLDAAHKGYVTFDEAYAFAAQRLHARREAKEQISGHSTLGTHEIRRRMMCRGLRAESYKLNTYSGPSGMFKPHVDTPRSDTQVGSLVVCLPVAFEGGALAVRHHGREIAHDWSVASSGNEPAIHWAAFYSDCQHEVLEVTAGHRITLTYNLFLAPGTGLLAGKPLSLQTPQLPIFRQIRCALTSPMFMPQGGYMAFELAHSYPHTHPKLHHFVPNMLKGADMALYEAVYSFGLTCVLEAVEGGALLRESALEDLERMQRHRRTHSLKHAGEASHEVFSYLHEVELNTGSGYEEDEGADEAEIDMHSSEDEDLIEDYGESEHGEQHGGLKKRMKVRERVTWVGVGWGCEELSKAFIAVSGFACQA